MKRLALILSLGLVGLAFVPQVPTNVTLAWDAQSGIDVFTIYHSTNLAVPLTNWTAITNVSGTNFTVALMMMPGAHFFYATGSNFWGESGPSNVTSTPPMPGNMTNVTIHR